MKLNTGRVVYEKEWSNGEKFICSERCFSMSAWRCISQGFGSVNCCFCMYLEEEPEKMNSSVWGKLNKGVSNVTVSSKAVLFKGTASKGSSEGSTWPLPSLLQLYRVAQNNTIMWERRDNFIVYLLGAFILSCLTIGPVFQLV